VQGTATWQIVALDAAGRVTAQSEARQFSRKK
jgi:hypothetical protein